MGPSSIRRHVQRNAVLVRLHGRHQRRPEAILPAHTLAKVQIATALVVRSGPHADRRQGVRRHDLRTVNAGAGHRFAGIVAGWSSHRGRPFGLVRLVLVLVQRILLHGLLHVLLLLGRRLRNDDRRRQRWRRSAVFVAVHDGRRGIAKVVRIAGLIVDGGQQRPGRMWRRCQRDVLGHSVDGTWQHDVLVLVRLWRQLLRMLLRMLLRIVRPGGMQMGAGRAGGD